MGIDMQIEFRRELFLLHIRLPDRQILRRSAFGGKLCLPWWAVVLLL